MIQLETYNQNEIRIRYAEETDAEKLLAIYSPYVTDTAITFEYEVPSEEEFRHRIRKTKQKYPYLVLEKDAQPIGYAYVSPFKERAAYDWAVETSIYLKQSAHGKGYGKLLYQALEDCLKEMHILNVNACIAYTEQEDEHLTNASMHFHEHSGYRLVGTFHQCGYKFGKWYDMIWMEKMIGEHTWAPQPVNWNQ